MHVKPGSCNDQEPAVWSMLYFSVAVIELIAGGYPYQMILRFLFQNSLHPHNPQFTRSTCLQFHSSAQYCLFMCNNVCVPCLWNLVFFFYFSQLLRKQYSSHMLVWTCIGFDSILTNGRVMYASQRIHTLWEKVALCVSYLRLSVSVCIQLCVCVGVHLAVCLCTCAFSCICNGVS